MNNAQWEVLLKLVVPAIFVLSWVFKQAVNPDTKMPKMPAGRGKPVTRPQGQPPVRGNPGPGRIGGEPMRPTSRPEPLAPGRLSPGQEMVIVGSETRPARAPAEIGRNPRATDRGRNDQRPNKGRGKSSGSRGTGRTSGGPESLIGGGSLTERGGLIERPAYVGPLTSMDGSLSSDPTGSVGAQDAFGTPLAGRSADQLRSLLQEPSRLREAFVLNEILQPPVARRRRQARR